MQVQLKCLSRLQIEYLCIAVCTSLVSNGDQQDEETTGGRRRQEVVLALARMNPKEIYNIRALCVGYSLICMY